MSETYDAFRQGVKPGGMIKTSQIRLLICYILNSLKTPVSKNVITECLCETGLVNYFEIGNAMETLVDMGNLKKIEDGDTEKYTVTETGSEIAVTLETDLPRSVREKALSQAIYCATMEKRRNENEILIEPDDDGYRVTFHVGKQRNKILSLTIYVPDYKQADALKKGFLNDPEGLCEGIFKALLDQ